MPKLDKYEYRLYIQIQFLDLPGSTISRFPLPGSMDVPQTYVAVLVQRMNNF